MGVMKAEIQPPEQASALAGSQSKSVGILILVVLAVLVAIGFGVNYWINAPIREADRRSQETKRVLANTDEFLRLSRLIQAAPAGSAEQERLIDEMEKIQPGFRRSIEDAETRRATHKQAKN